MAVRQLQRVADGPAVGFRRILAAYVALTKPRIIELLLVTTVPVMFLAQRGVPALSTVLLTLVGGSLAAGGANALNCYLDRDIDALMERTGHRPTVTGAVTPRATVTFGITLSVLSVIWLTLFVNLWSAAFGAAAIFLYVVGYTIVLKRRTSSNIVWGGVAGCFPVLIGWVAVTGSISWAPIVLFLVVFFWTPPHYWPLSLKYREEYAAAGVPMLPVVATDAHVARRIVAYSWVMVGTSLVLIPVAPMGWVYTAAAVVLGVWFLADAHALSRRLHRGATDVRAMKLFHGSIGYLTLLFLAVAIDPFVGPSLF
jgi:heme o synthase